MDRRKLYGVVGVLAVGSATAATGPTGIAGAQQEPIGDSKTTALSDEWEAPPGIFPAQLQEGPDLADNAFVTEFRNKFGLPAGHAYVRSLDQDSAAQRAREKFGLALSPGEVERVERQLRLQTRLAERQASIPEHVGSTYAGVAIDQAAGGIVTIFATRPVTTDVLAAVAAELETDPSLLAVEVVTTSLDELTSAYEALNASLAKKQPGHEAVTSVSIGTRENTIRVVHSGTDEEAAAYVAMVFGDDVPEFVRIHAQTRVIGVNTARDFDPTWAAGGVRYELRVGTGFARCSVGPPLVRRKSDGKLLALTAGHCTRNRINWPAYWMPPFSPNWSDAFNTTFQVGGTSAADAGMLDYNGSNTVGVAPIPPCNRVYKTSTNKPCLGSAVTANPAVGSVLYGTNGYSGNKISEVVNSSHTGTQCDSIYGSNCSVVVNQIKVAWNAQPSDSGSPWFFDGTRPKFVGIGTAQYNILHSNGYIEPIGTAISTWPQINHAYGQAYSLLFP